MAELHDALTYLSPVEWRDVPTDNLKQYLADCFKAAELIINSVPQPAKGTPFADSKPHHQTPNSAKSHQEIHPSDVRPQPPHEEHGSLQKNWGKPMKFKEKDNPLNISVYKMAGHDRHGAWFARKSIHEGLGFDKIKRAMMREFSASMAVTGGPGAGAVRGLAADRRLEQMDVQGVGKLQVYELSAQFPGPVTPRDFMAMLLTSDDALSHMSAAEVNGGKKHVPRHFVIVSRPIDHPDGQTRPGFVRGHYESVELIREVPLSTTDNADGNPELNPIEWIMVTRSDPGGGIPRFLVDRGTPEAMLADVHKFYNWACAQDHIPDADEDLPRQDTDSAQEAVNSSTQESSVPSDQANKTSVQDVSSESLELRETGQVATEQSAFPNGIVPNITKAIETGIYTYAPASVSNLVHRHLDSAPADDISDESSDDSSTDSFLSAKEIRRMSTAPEEPLGGPADSTDTLSLASGAGTPGTPGTPRESKELQRLAKKREKLDQQLLKKRVAEEEKVRQSQEKEESETSKAKEEMDKKQKKIEEKYQREIEKLEKKKQKEELKTEERRRKKDDQSRMAWVTRERDEFRSQCDIFRRENALLREQMAELQAQNTAMAQQLGKLGGEDALTIPGEVNGHKRATSLRSTASSDSIAKGLEKKAEAS